jgi:hypothetical protein
MAENTSDISTAVAQLSKLILELKGSPVSYFADGKLTRLHCVDTFSSAIVIDGQLIFCNSIDQSTCYSNVKCDNPGTAFIYRKNNADDKYYNDCYYYCRYLIDQAGKVKAHIFDKIQEPLSPTKTISISQAYAFRVLDDEGNLFLIIIYDSSKYKATVFKRDGTIVWTQDIEYVYYMKHVVYDDNITFIFKYKYISLSLLTGEVKGNGIIPSNITEPLIYDPEISLYFFVKDSIIYYYDKEFQPVGLEVINFPYDMRILHNIIMLKRI